MSIYNRPYMRESFGTPGHFGALKWILIVLGGAFVIQTILERVVDVTSHNQWLALSLAGIENGYVHTLLTHALLHSWWGGYPSHLLFNALALFTFGRDLEPRLGSFRFLETFLLGVVGGGLFFLLVHVFVAPQAVVVGASGGVLAIICLFCLVHFDEEVQMLFFTLKGKHLLALIGGIEVFCFIFSELLGSSGEAFSAHLGGMAWGWVTWRYFLAQPAWLELAWRRVTSGRRKGTAAPSWARRAAAVKAKGGARYTVNVSGSQDLRSEVDRILDKINSQGFGSLTEEEKRTLDRAKDDLR